MSVFAKNDEGMVEENRNNVALVFLKKVKDKITSLNEKNKWVVPGITLGAAFLVILFVLLIIGQVISVLKTTSNQNNAVIRRELNDVSAQLQALSSNPQNSSQFQSALSTLHNDISGIQKSFNEIAKSSDVQQVSHQISSMKDDVDAEMLDIKRSVSNGTAAKQYIDATVLPFRVISIDVLSQQPFVSINYSNHISPLAVGDALAGWTIVSADYGTSTVELKNSSDQYVKVIVQG